MALPNARKLQRPVGMEFLTSADREHLYGRESKLKELLDAIENNRITLLLGNSGTGKTSLIHAGL
jgi:putative ribosome biogenesis GTPase RsgA